MKLARASFAVLITVSIYYSMYAIIAFSMLFALLRMWPINHDRDCRTSERRKCKRV